MNTKKLGNKKMAENAKLLREQRKLETNSNVPLVDENLYVYVLRSRNIPFNT